MQGSTTTHLRVRPLSVGKKQHIIIREDLSLAFTSPQCGRFLSNTENKLSHLAAPSPPAWQLPGFWLDQGQPNTHRTNFFTLQFPLLHQLRQLSGNWAPWILTWLAPASHTQTFSPCSSFSTSLAAPVLPVTHNCESIMHRSEFWCTD